MLIQSIPTFTMQIMCCQRRGSDEYQVKRELMISGDEKLALNLSGMYTRRKMRNQFPDMGSNTFCQLEVVVGWWFVSIPVFGE